MDNLGQGIMVSMIAMLIGAVLVGCALGAGIMWLIRHIWH